MTKKIIIISHYFPPEIGAPQARLFEMANIWAKKKHEVSVLTCFPNHPTGIVPNDYKDLYKKRKLFHEKMGDLNVFRCWAYATSNKGFLKKLFGHLAFMFTAVLQGHKVVKGKDLILVSSPTFFCVISAYILSRFYKTPYIFEVRDLWPAIFIELGVIKNKFIIAILEHIEMFLYQKAAAVVTVTESFTRNIVERGIESRKSHTIKNGVNLDSYFFRPKNKELLQELQLEDKFIILYIGAHGISHSLCKIIDAAKRLESNEIVHFLFVGEGAEKEKMMSYCSSLHLKNVTFLPGQPKEKVVAFYSIMDVGLVPLRNIPLFDSFIPSKMFEIMGMQKPIVASVRGEAANILQESGGALISDPEDDEVIAENILRLFNDQQLAAKLGENGRKYAENNYSRSKFAKDYLEIMDKVLEG